MTTAPPAALAVDPPDPVPAPAPTSGATRSLPELGVAVRPGVLAADRLLPVLPPLRPLLPDGGLRRGSVMTVDGATSLALAMVAAASTAGSWCAAVAVGRPSLHPEAAAELGVVLERFPLVAARAGSGPGGWAWVVAALLDAVDVVVAWPPTSLRAADARRLVARGRERGSVLVVAGRRDGPGWPEAADVHLRVTASSWAGIGAGHGRLLTRRVEVVAGGRRAATRQRRAVLWLPAPGGR